MGAQRGHQVMHQPDVGRLVEAGAVGQQAEFAEDALGLFMAGFRQIDLVRLAIDPVIAGWLFLACLGLLLHLGEERRQPVDPLVGFGVVLGLAGNDQRRARLVDQDRIDLVDDRVAQLALAPIANGVLHVVAQVIEAELIVGAVGDVGGVGIALLGGQLLGEDLAHRHPEKVVDLAHPVGVATCQVIVDRDNVHALARQRIQIDGERSGQGFALARAHLGNLARVQHHAADQLHIEMAHPEHAPRRLATDGKSLWQERVEGLAVGDALAKFVGLGRQLLVGEGRYRRLERIDCDDRLAESLQHPLIATAEDSSQEFLHHGNKRGRECDGRTAGKINLQSLTR